MAGTIVWDTNNGITLGDGSQIQSFNSLGMRNRIINGAMMISQRGTSFSAPSSGNYNLDRWFATWNGAAPASISQVAGIGNYSKATQITGAASNTLVYFIQRIESNNCSDLSGQTVTIQATIAVSSPQTVLWSLAYPTAQDNYTSVGFITGGTGTWSATTTATTFTATIPSLPSGALNGLQLLISPNNGGAFTSGTITITGVQLEKGTAATPFEWRHYGTELALCQRYLPAMSYSGGSNPYLGAGMAYGTTSAYYTISFPVTPRVPPTGLVVSSASHFSGFLANSAVSAATGFVFGGANSHSAFVQLTGMSGLSGGNASLIYMNNSAALLYFTGGEL